jgi:prevent-host-death family protein
MPKAEARKRFSEVTTRVGRRGERVKITHYGKTLAVLVSKQDLQKLDDCENGHAQPARAAGGVRRAAAGTGSRRRR